MAPSDLITPKILIDFSNSAAEVICKLFNGRVSATIRKMEKIYYHNDTEDRKKPHHSVILQTNKFIIAPV